MVTVICPYCKSVMQKSCGCSTTCPSCKARLEIGSNGAIKRSFPPKKK